MEKKLLLIEENIALLLCESLTARLNATTKLLHIALGVRGQAPSTPPSTSSEPPIASNTHLNLIVENNRLLLGAGILVPMVQLLTESSLAVYASSPFVNSPPPPYFVQFPPFSATYHPDDVKSQLFSLNLSIVYVALEVNRQNPPLLPSLGSS